MLDFVDHKKQVNGLSVAINHKEWLVKFIAVIQREDISDLTYEDVLSFKDWLLNKYAGDYMVGCGLHSVRCFLRFCRRYDILCDMANVGRKPNLKKIEETKLYRSKEISYRDIQALMKHRTGKKYDLKTLQFWANYPVRRH